MFILIYLYYYDKIAVVCVNFIIGYTQRVC